MEMLEGMIISFRLNAPLLLKHQHQGSIYAYGMFKIACGDFAIEHKCSGQRKYLRAQTLNMGHSVNVCVPKCFMYTPPIQEQRRKCADVHILLCLHPQYPVK